MTEAKGRKKYVSSLLKSTGLGSDQSDSGVFVRHSSFTASYSQLVEMMCFSRALLRLHFSLMYTRNLFSMLPVSGKSVALLGKRDIIFLFPFSPYIFSIKYNKADQNQIISSLTSTVFCSALLLVIKLSVLQVFHYIYE